MTRAPWLRSSACFDTNCVEVLIDADRVRVRSSRRRDVVVEFDRGEWAAFLAGVKAGEFEEPSVNDG